VIRLKKIVSGGQTGVDQAALDVAIEFDIEHGGWCPLGRICEFGTIPAKYRLTETESPEYKVRTERNVIESDATLILYRRNLTAGTAYTYRQVKKHRKPHLLVDLESHFPVQSVVHWLRDAHVAVLNIAGPRESTAVGIGRQSYQFLATVIHEIHDDPSFTE
jgi:hypothetical protein